MSIGSKIKELREARNMSLEDVARMCGTTRQAIYKYENEIVTNIPYDRIILLAKALNTTPSQLFDWDDNKKISPNELALTEGERDMLNLFKQIPEDQQPVVLAMIRAALCSGK
jgi:transcriptional regulator with XRE-family HTH domain